MLWNIRSRTSVHIPKRLSITRSLSVRSLKQWRVATLSATSYSAAQAMARRWLPTGIKGVRCALCWNVETARLARQHNDANIISLGQRMMSEEEALKIVRVWIETGFEVGRHVRRIQLLDLGE